MIIRHDKVRAPELQSQYSDRVNCRFVNRGRAKGSSTEFLGSLTEVVPCTNDHEVYCSIHLFSFREGVNTERVLEDIVRRMQTFKVCFY